MMNYLYDGLLFYQKDNELMVDIVGTGKCFLASQLVEDLQPVVSRARVAFGMTVHPCEKCRQCHGDKPCAILANY